MMVRMIDTKKSWWRRQIEQVLLKDAAKARKKGKPLKVYSSKDLQFYLDNGWKILSYNPVSYGSAQYWLLIPVS